MQDDLQSFNFRKHRILAAIAFIQAANSNTQMSSVIGRDFLLMSEICQQFEGQVLKSADNSLLMYFISPVGAVACALEIQKALAAQAAKLSAQEVLQHRIGIHLGEVFFADGELMGNGLGVAAQLQAIAEPGGIYLSQTVYDAVKLALGLQASYVGSKELENIDQPVPIYRVLLPSNESDISAETGVGVSDAEIHLTREEYCDRQTLIRLVRNFWIKGVLEKSLQNRALIALGFHERTDAIQLPWALTEYADNDTLPLLASTTKVADKFPKLAAGQTLLILGEPGAGKTTTLLELTRNLLVQGEHDFTQPIPVVFNLSAWRGERQPIANWVVQELKVKYQVDHELGQNWVNNQHLLLVLDGLDEIKTERRDACVQAINQFSQQYPQTGIIVASRLQDYEALTTRLKLQAAVCLQPLSLEQIYQYLDKAGLELAALKTVLREDVGLQELARSPLMLNLMTLVYQGKSGQDFPKLYSIEERRQHLFNTYIERGLKGRKSHQQYPQDKARRWLIWLARKMNQKSQNWFFIEELQTSWLNNIWQKILYVIVVVILTGLLGGLISAANVTLVADWQLGQQEGLFFGSLAGAIAGLIIGVIYHQIKPVQALKWSLETAKTAKLENIIFVAITGAILGGVGDILYGLVFGTRHSYTEIISFGLKVGLASVLILILFQGLTSTNIATSTIPNQGIWQSVNNGRIFFLFGAIGIGLVASIVGLPMWIGAITGLIFAIFGAGEAGVKHLALRIVLACNRYIPGNYARFLDWAAERYLLQKVGGGYIFIHRLIMEHLAQIPYRF